MAADLDVRSQIGRLSSDRSMNFMSKIPYSAMKDTQSTNDVVQATIAERGKVYGDATLSHENIGLAWTALIQQHYQIRLDHAMPSWLVELMMVSFKVHRAARVFHADNYVDARAYLQFAEKDQQPQSNNNKSHA